MKITAARKEDNHYFYGPFWIIGDTLKDVFRGNFTLECAKWLCDYNGNDVSNENLSKSRKTHRVIWRDNLANKYDEPDYTYYPRGRIAVYNGTAFIHLNSRCNLPKIVDALIDEYQLDGLDIEVEENDTYQGSHYNFKLT